MSKVLIAGLVVQHDDGSTTVVELGAADTPTIRTRKHWWQRVPQLVITFPAFTGAYNLTFTPSGLLPAAPASLPDLPVDSTATRYEDARRLNAA